MKYITKKKTASWAELAHKFGYYDQKHLRHDLHYFTGLALKNGLTPAAGLELALDF